MYLLFGTVQADLNSFADAAELNLRFLAMLAGPFYPILDLGKERHVLALYLPHCAFPNSAFNDCMVVIDDV